MQAFSLLDFILFQSPSESVRQVDFIIGENTNNTKLDKSEGKSRLTPPPPKLFGPASSVI